MANEIRITVKGDNDAKPALASARRGTEELGEAARETSRDLLLEAASAKILDREIDANTHRMRQLATQIAQTGDEAERNRLDKILGDERAVGNKLRSLRKLFADEGGESARSFIQWFRDKLGSLPSEVKGAAIVGATGVAALMAPFIGSVFGGAVLGAVGGGGIAGGIALAAQDSRVQAEAKKLGDMVMSQLTAEAGVFVNPVIGALRGLTPVAQEASIAVGRIFDTVAPLIPVVTSGLSGLVRNVLPGLERAALESRAPIRGLANELPELGDAVTDMLDSISDGSDEGTAALIGLVDALGWTIRQTGEFIHILEVEYGWLRTTGNAVHDFGVEHGLLGDVLTGLLGGVFNEFAASMDDQTAKMEAAKSSTNDYAGSFETLIRNTEREKEVADALTQAFDDLFTVQMRGDRANIRYEESLDQAIETLKDGKRTLDIHTEAGRENAEAILDVAEASARQHSAGEITDAQYVKQIQSLRALALRLGFSKKQVDDLVGAYLKVPAKVSTQVTAPGLAGVLARMRELDRLFRASAGYLDYRRGERGYASGGAVSTAQTGGSRGGSVLMHEQGPELTRLPNGSVVVPAGMSQQLMNGWAGGGGMTQLEILPPSRSSGLAWADALVEMIRFKVHSEGGNDPSTYLARR